MSENEATEETPRPVVVGVDGTDDGARALRYAAMLALRDDRPLRVVHVVQEAMNYTPMLAYVPWESFADIGTSVLDEAARQAAELGCGPDRVTTVLARGARISALVEHLDDASCLVLGTRHSALQHLLTGATTSAVAAHSPVPVFCVPAVWSRDVPARERVVVGLHGPDDVTEVLDRAFEEAASRQAQLQIVHAWRPTGFYEGAMSARTLEEHWSQEESTRLEKVIREAAAAVPEVRWTLTMDFDRPVVALHEAAALADLLVLGRRGHRVPFGLRVGSTTRALLRTATCPVMVVPMVHHEDE